MNCKPRTWWKEVKTLRGLKSATQTDPLSALTQVQPGPNSSPTTLADTVNEAFLDPMSMFKPLGRVSAYIYIYMCVCVCVCKIYIYI